MVAWSTTNGSVAVIAGVRSPLTRAGTALRRVHVTELARCVFRETLDRAAFDAGALDEVILGNVVMPADATNPARVAALYAGVPEHVPAFTVQRNCASGMEAVAQAAALIRRGDATAVLAGGAESMSTVPLLLPDETLEPMGRLAKARTLKQKIAALLSLRPRHFKPLPALKMGLTDPVCGMIMGMTAEVLAKEFGIGRREQDRFALESHRRVAAAQEAGFFDELITPIYAGKSFEPVTADIGPRPRQTAEALAKLSPLFDRRDGTVTVGNSCQITDGAASLLLVGDEAAREQRLPVLGHVRAYATAALDPARMGLGPVFAIDRLLRETGLDLSDIGLFEINEAFAAQVIACTRALDSEAFARQHLGRDRAIGPIDPQKLNVHGGAIALGHPVGATGARLVLTLLAAMRRRDVDLGIAALCVGGGQGAAILLQKA